MIHFCAWMAIVFTMTSCSYRVGYRHRQLPGSSAQVAIPVFKNRTQEVGMEIYFTNELRQQFARSRVARVVDRDVAPVILEGVVEFVDYKTQGYSSKDLPGDSVITSKYAIDIRVHLMLRRNSDQKVLWESYFNGVRSYDSPRIGREVVNSANALYNHSARHSNIAQMAQELMVEAHDRLTERF